MLPAVYALSNRRNYLASGTVSAVTGENVVEWCMTVNARK